MSEMTHWEEAVIHLHSHNTGCVLSCALCVSFTWTWTSTNRNIVSRSHTHIHTQSRQIMLHHWANAPTNILSDVVTGVNQGRGSKLGGEAATETSSCCNPPPHSYTAGRSDTKLLTFEVKYTYTTDNFKGQKAAVQLPVTELNDL